MPGDSVTETKSNERILEGDGRHTDGGTREGSFKAWMFNIARNITLDHLRKTKRAASMTPVEETAEPQLIDHRSAEQAAAAKQNVNLVARALANLPTAVQEVIWLGRFEFNSYEELGRAVGCKTGAARVRMHRAIQQLNTEFETINGAPIDV